MDSRKRSRELSQKVQTAGPVGVEGVEMGSREVARDTFIFVI